MFRLQAKHDIYKLQITSITPILSEVELRTYESCGFN